MRSNSSILPSDMRRDSSIFPRRSRFSKMFSAGGQVPTQMVAPASAIALPALLAAGLPPHLALGTNKAQGVFGTCASTLRYARAGLLDGKRARITFPLGL